MTLDSHGNRYPVSTGPAMRRAVVEETEGALRAVKECTMLLSGLSNPWFGFTV